MMRLTLKLDDKLDDGDAVEAVYELPESWAPAVVGLLNTIQQFHQVNPSKVLIKLQDVGNKKIQVIKCLRAAFGWSLVVTKQRWVDQAPITLPGLDPLKAQILASELRMAGATVSGETAIDRLAALAADPIVQIKDITEQGGQA